MTQKWLKLWAALLALGLSSGGMATAVADEVSQPEPFQQHAVPFLQAHCAGCHGADFPEGNLSLVPFEQSASVVRDRRTWGKILQRIQSGEMPPEGEERPTDEEIEQLVSTIQGIQDDFDRNAEPDPGRVTVRRLNREEYNNTVQDLIGIDYEPAEDFPADGIGFGFDNIGDTLSISPVLMERYLNAAEGIATRALMPKLPRPPRRNLDARVALPRRRGLRGKKFRELTTSTEEESEGESGPLILRYKDTFQAVEEYRFRVRVYGQAAEGQNLQLAVLAIGDDVENPADDVVRSQLVGDVEELGRFTIVHQATVEARSDDSVQSIEFDLGPGLTFDQFAVALVRPEGDVPVSVFIQDFLLEGPMDMRTRFQKRYLTGLDDLPDAEKTRAVLQPLLLRAYRRPPTEQEIDDLVEFVKAVQADGASWNVSMQQALVAILVNPKFLFRLELDDRPESPEPRPIGEFQLASRLSYFLWSTMPDDELLELAAQGQLKANLDAQIARMLQDPRSGEFVANFSLQWLQLQRLSMFRPDPKQFPDFDEELRQAMLQETVLFMQEIFLEDRSILEMLNADFTYLNEPLARHYGIADTAGNSREEARDSDEGERIRGTEFVRVTLQSGERGGIPTQASILSATSNPTRTSPVKRGRWILEQILGDQHPPPPPGVPELVEPQEGQLTGSLRERLEQHRENPACAQCHARMDPIGFAFENYDATGAWRTQDGEFELETAGKLPDGTSFEGPADFKKVLQGLSDPFTRNLTEQLMTYALGRGIEYYDRPVIDRIQSRLKESDYRSSVLISEIIKSEPFLMRRGLEPVTAEAAGE